MQASWLPRGDCCRPSKVLPAVRVLADAGGEPRKPLYDGRCIHGHRAIAWVAVGSGERPCGVSRNLRPTLTRCRTVFAVHSGHQMRQVFALVSLVVWLAAFLAGCGGNEPV